MEKKIMENIFRDINRSLSEEDILMLSPLHLAYIGDGVYELFIRSYLLSSKTSVNAMNKKARALVNARSQSIIIHMLEDFLTEGEIRIFKRGRNAKTGSSPKNMDIMDYKHATGFEALLGHLYLKREYGRLYEIMDMILYRETEMKLQGGIFKLDSKDRDNLELELKKILDANKIYYENFSLEILQEDAEEGELKIDFPMDIIDFDKDEKKIGQKILDYLESQGLSFGGGWSLEFKEEANEG